MTESIYSKLAKAQGKFDPVEIDKHNRLYDSRYASLSACLKAVRPHLSEVGLSVGQDVATVINDAGQLIVHCTTWIADDTSRLSSPVIMIPVDQIVSRDGKKSPLVHALGSMITYVRRYSLCAFLNIVGDEDDDGNAAAQQSQQRTTSAPPPPRKDQTPEQKFKESFVQPPEEKIDPNSAGRAANFIERIAAAPTMEALNDIVRELTAEPESVRKACRQAFSLRREALSELQEAAS